MKLLKRISQFRRDFKGEYQCEGCGYIMTDESLDSYNDRNYHDNVVPRMKCPKCGKSTLDLGLVPEFIKTKYRSDEVV